MHFTSWLKKWQRRRGATVQPATVSAITESLEGRQLLAVSVLFVSNELQLVSDGDDTIRVSASGGNVVVVTGPAGGQQQPLANLGSIPAGSVLALSITGGDQENTIDLSGVLAAEFSALTNIEVHGGNGADALTGSPDLNDSLDGENGSDTLLGQGGNDTLDGGDGADLIDAGTGNDNVLAGDGTDNVTTGDGNDTVDGGNGSDTVSLGDGDDSIFAGNGEDEIDGGAGNDTLNGDGGTDTVIGGSGNDSILGGELGDSLVGGDGNDTINGQAGNDTVTGDAGDDSLIGGIGNDSLVAGDGNDFVNGNADNDTIIGNAGNDRIYGGTGDDSLLGDGTDALSTDSGDDTILGQGGKDTVIGGRGADTLDGGIGQDSVASSFTVEVVPPPPPPPPAPPPPPPPPMSGNLFPDAVCLGPMNPLGNQATLISGTVDGDSEITINGVGQLGGFFNGPFYNPLGPVGRTDVQNISTTTYISTPQGTRTQLRASTFNVQMLGNATEASSSFTDATYGMSWTMCVNIQKLFDPSGTQIGSFMTRTYMITNTTATAQNFDIVNFNHMHLSTAFGNVVFGDGGGHIPNPGGTELILESDRVGSPSTVTAFVAISGVHGTVPTTNRFELDAYPGLESRIAQGQALDDTVANDFDGDEFTDLADHSVIALRNAYSLNPGETALYTAHTIFGNADPTTIGVPPTNVIPVAANDTGTSIGGFPATIDVVSNDTDSDGALVYNTIQIDTQPVNGTAVSLGNGLVQYTPVVGFSGIDTFTYSIGDNFGGRSNPATVTINVLGADSIGDLILGSDDNDTLIGNAGDDTINGGGGNDSVDGGIGEDSLLGGSGMDVLFGSIGDDTLNGQGGADILDGGEAHDTIIWDGAVSSNDLLGDVLGDNSLIVQGTGAANVFTVGMNVNFLLTVTDSGKFVTVGPTFGKVIINGGNGNDAITVGNIALVPFVVLEVHGDAGNDVLSAAGSAIGDVRLLIDGGDGNDTLSGSTGDDTLSGAAGADMLEANEGNDTLLGGDGNDTISGGAGNDSLSGELGHDSLLGGDGNDVGSGGDGQDTLNGGAGNDTLSGNAGDDSLLGTAGADSLLGDVGADTLGGGDGADTLDGGRNDDSLIGGLGNDKLRGDHGNDTIDGGDGNDTANGGDGDDAVNGGLGADGLNGSDGNDTVNGGAGNDTIVGGDGNDALLGGGGNDLVLGDDGADLINGQSGTDTVAGNQGVDVIVDPAAEINEAFVLSAAIRSALEAL